MFSVFVTAGLPSSGVTTRSILSGPKLSPDAMPDSVKPLIDSQVGNGVPDECECIGDIDGDGVVDAGDLAAVLGAWGRCDGCAEDLDGSGVVGSSDLALILVAWGGC